jgi:hypothetical protein
VTATYNVHALAEAVAALLLVAGVLMACASAEPVFRLNATAADSSAAWVQGRQVVARTVGGLRTLIAYDHSTDHSHVFHLGVENRADTTVLIDPSRTYAALQRMPPGFEGMDLKAPMTADTVSVRDPEAKLLALDMARSREAADEMNDRLVNGLVLTLDAAGDVADSFAGGRTDEERTADAAEDAEWALRRAEDRAAYRRQLEDLAESRFHWSERVLRKTTLPPGAYTAGWVYVPIREDAQTVTLHVQVGSHTVTVPYRQQRFEP